jgi:hypothetical protein
MFMFLPENEREIIMGSTIYVCVRKRERERKRQICVKERDRVCLFVRIFV